MCRGGVVTMVILTIVIVHQAEEVTTAIFLM